MGVAGGTLTISSVMATDSQLYTCTASNIVGSNSTTVELNVLGEWREGVEGGRDSMSLVSGGRESGAKNITQVHEWQAVYLLKTVS